MSVINGCNLPDDYFYYIDKHVWAKPMDGDTIRVGMTTVAAKLSGGKLAAITVKAKSIGTEVNQGKSIATVESSKYVGPVPAPISGVLLRGNDQLTTNPNLAISDPYGEGWIAEMKASDWSTQKETLLTGPEGLAKYKEKLDAEGISCA